MRILEKYFFLISHFSLREMAMFSIGQFYFTFCLFCASRINKREKVYSSLTPLINLSPPGGDPTFARMSFGRIDLKALAWD